MVGATGIINNGGRFKLLVAGFHNQAVQTGWWGTVRESVVMCIQA